MSVEHASQEHPPELQPQPTTILLNFGSFTAQETFGNVQRHWTSLVAQMVKGFPCNSDGKESTCNVKDLGSIPGLGRSTGGEHGHPLHYFCLENLHGQRSLVGHSPWGRKESDMTERLSTAQRHWVGTAGAREICWCLVVEARVLLDISQCTGPPPMKGNRPGQNVSSAEAEVM